MSYGKCSSNSKQAQAQLLAKDPATRARIDTATQKATQEAARRQHAESALLANYYKDKPQTIELAVRAASTSSLRKNE